MRLLYAVDSMPRYVLHRDLRYLLDRLLLGHLMYSYRIFPVKRYNCL